MLKWKELLSKFSSPIQRLEKYMVKQGLIKESDTKQYREEARDAVKEALKNANEAKKPHIDELFNDVYDEIPHHIEEQRKELKEHFRKYQDKYDLGIFEDGENYPFK